jgi:hypothetical protein
MRIPAALAISSIGHPPQDCDHAQLLQQRGIERNLVQTVEDVARGTWRAGALDRIDLNQHGIA